MSERRKNSRFGFVSDEERLEGILEDYNGKPIYVKNTNNEGVYGFVKGFDRALREEYIVLVPSAIFIPSRNLKIENEIPTKLLMPLTIIRPLGYDSLEQFVKEYNIELNKIQNKNSQNNSS